MPTNSVGHHKNYGTSLRLRYNGRMEDNNQPRQQKIVIAEDNAALSDIYSTRLEMIGYKCFAAYDGEQALEIIEREQPDLVLLDLMMPKIAGDQILARMRSSDWGKDIRVYIISNLNEEDAPSGLREYGISGYAVKANLTNDDIDKLVDQILTPEGQEDISLESEGQPVEHNERPQVQHNESHDYYQEPVNTTQHKIYHDQEKQTEEPQNTEHHEHQEAHEDHGEQQEHFENPEHQDNQEHDQEHHDHQENY